VDGYSTLIGYSALVLNDGASITGGVLTLGGPGSSASGPNPVSSR